MRFMTIASSSKGNASYAGVKNGGWLIDCGVSCRRIEQGLSHIPGALEGLHGVLITHEHSDHIAGLGPFLRRHRLPCYASSGTLEMLLDGRLGKVDASLFHAVDDGFELDGWRISTYALSHDAKQPLGYALEKDVRKIALATDTGVITDKTLAQLYDSDLLYIEANHDQQMLAAGPYPPHLKRRIAGDYGHLSNEACADALRQVITQRTRHVVLGHLSEHNNRPDTAFRAVRENLLTARQPLDSFSLWVADPQQPASIDLTLGGAQDTAKEA